jgi:hypothetical protein
MKHGLTSGARPKLSILPRAGLVYGGRGIEYGGDKYARGNYFGPPPPALGEAELAATRRLLGYLDATLRHVTETADAINRALGTGGDLGAACAVADDLASGGFPASGLPHLAHAISSLLIGVTCAVDDGLLPEDPGQPWTKSAEDGLPQKDDAASERERVERRIGGERRLAPAPPPPDGWLGDVRVKQSEPAMTDAEFREDAEMRRG